MSARSQPRNDIKVKEFYSTLTLLITTKLFRHLFVGESITNSYKPQYNSLLLILWFFENSTLESSIFQVCKQHERFHQPCKKKLLLFMPKMCTWLMFTAGDDIVCVTVNDKVHDKTRRGHSKFLSRSPVLFFSTLFKTSCHLHLFATRLLYTSVFCSWNVIKGQEHTGFAFPKNEGTNNVNSVLMSWRNYQACPWNIYFCSISYINVWLCHPNPWNSHETSNTKYITLCAS